MTGRAVAVVGSTASGKSSLAMELARARPEFEIVSVDSMQVYRGMDIGTAKPTPAEQAEVRHHLIDIADPWDDHDVATHQAAARAARTDVEARGSRVLYVGGTGLYLRAVIDDLTLPGRFPAVRDELEADPDTVGLHRRLVELDPVAAARMEPGNRRRVIRALEVTLGSGRPFSSFGPGLEAHPASTVTQVGLRRTRADLDARIAARYAAQLDAGFLGEVETLLASPRPLSRSAAQALGYKELAEHVRGRCALDEAVHVAITRTRQFARRQEKWFRRDPRITWIDVDPATRSDELVGRVREVLAAAPE